MGISKRHFPDQFACYLKIRSALLKRRIYMPRYRLEFKLSKVTPKPLDTVLACLLGLLIQLRSEQSTLDNKSPEV